MRKNLEDYRKVIAGEIVREKLLELLDGPSPDTRMEAEMIVEDAKAVQIQ